MNKHKRTPIMPHTRSRAFLRRRSGTQRGFSMIEVLISLVLIAVAMLGQAGMQANALRFAKSGEQRMSGVFLSNELVERMEGNKAAAIAGSYAVPLASSTVLTAGTDCSAVPCAATALAAFDLAEWTTRAAAVLPSATWQVTQTVSGNPSTYSIVLTWQDRRADSTRTTYSTSGTTETFSVTSTRVIYQ
jgi:type IV pilus assembly protein PilV